MIFQLPAIAAAFMLTFARVGTLVMLMPGLGERFIAARLRLAFAVLLALVLYPMTRQILPSSLTPEIAVTLLFGEIIVGLVLGLATRMVMGALQTAGTIISQQLGLAFSMSLDPSMGGQQAAIGNFLSLMAITLIFTTDLHHLAIAAINHSYEMLPPGGPFAAGDVSMLGIKSVSLGFSLAIRISAPFIAFGILFNLGLGVLSRLMPQFQVFFLAMPASILIGMALFMAVMAVMMSVFTGDLSAFLKELGGV